MGDKWSRSFVRSNEIAGPVTDWGGGNAIPGWLSDKGVIGSGI